VIATCRDGSSPFAERPIDAAARWTASRLPVSAALGRSDATPTPTVQAALDRVLRERVGVREAPVTHRWAAIVGYTEDGLPVFGEARPGVWAAGAYSGTGNVVGALCGRAAARRAVGMDSEVAELLV